MPLPKPNPFVIDPKPVLADKKPTLGDPKSAVLAPNSPKSLSKEGIVTPNGASLSLLSLEKDFPPRG